MWDLKSIVFSRKIQRLSLYHINPPLSHNQFVDDTVVMGFPYIREYKSIKEILNEFMSPSRKNLNESKSQIFFFNNPLY